MIQKVTDAQTMIYGGTAGLGNATLTTAKRLIGNSSYSPKEVWAFAKRYPGEFQASYNMCDVTVGIAIAKKEPLAKFVGKDGILRIRADSNSEVRIFEAPASYLAELLGIEVLEKPNQLVVFPGTNDYNITEPREKSFLVKPEGWTKTIIGDAIKAYTISFENGVYCMIDGLPVGEKAITLRFTVPRNQFFDKMREEKLDYVEHSILVAIHNGKEKTETIKRTDHGIFFRFEIKSDMISVYTNANTDSMPLQILSDFGAIQIGHGFSGFRTTRVFYPDYAIGGGFGYTGQVLFGSNYVDSVAKSMVRAATENLKQLELVAAKE